MLKIPGFSAIIKALLQELKHQQVSHWKDDHPLIQTTVLLSKHEWFVPVFIEILLKRINAYKGRDVAFSMTLISRWLQQCETLPTNFEFKSFNQILVLLEERFDHEVAVQRTLLLLYHNLHKFPLVKRLAIIEQILAPDMFHRLFFHWSYNVRWVFCKLLLYQFEYFFVVKTCNTIKLQYDIEAYFNPRSALNLFKGTDDDFFLSNNIGEGVDENPTK